MLSVHNSVNSPYNYNRKEVSFQKKGILFAPPLCQLRKDLLSANVPFSRRIDAYVTNILARIASKFKVM